MQSDFWFRFTDTICFNVWTIGALCNKLILVLIVILPADKYISYIAAW